MGHEKMTLEVTLSEAKKIFEALGKLPFEEVYELIGKLNEQVNEHYEESQASATAAEQSKKSKQVHLQRNQGQ